MSARIQVTVEYAATLTEALRATLPGLLASNVSNALQTVGERMADSARHFVPVRTGFLLSTIGLELGADRWIFSLFARAPYAGYVEWGTRRMAARLYMTRALELHRDEMVQEVQNAVSAAVAEGLG